MYNVHDFKPRPCQIFTHSINRFFAFLRAGRHKSFPITTAMSAAWRPLLQLPSNSGVAATVFIRNAKPHIPIIVLIAHALS